MNNITIWEPRWSTGDVLIADYKLKEHNLITIQHKDFPIPLYLSANRAKKYPLEEMATKRKGIIQIRTIPIEELRKEVI